jgi:hypothetical protein
VPTVIASKHIKDSDKLISCKKLLWFLCIVYSMSSLANGVGKIATGTDTNNNIREWAGISTGGK